MVQVETRVSGAQGRHFTSISIVARLISNDLGKGMSMTEALKLRLNRMVFFIHISNGKIKDCDVQQVWNAFSPQIEGLEISKLQQKELRRICEYDSAGTIINEVLKILVEYEYKLRLGNYKDVPNAEQVFNYNNTLQPKELISLKSLPVSIINSRSY